MSFQDKKGYVWICSDAGVNQFDGKYFRKYTADNGLADNDILKMYEDKKGRIWFLSYNGHLSYFSYEDLRFHNELTDPYLKQAYLGSEYNFGFVDSRNRIWLGTMNGVCCMIDDTNVTTIKFELVWPDIGICFSEDIDGNIFMFRGYSKFLYNEKTKMADLVGPFPGARFSSYFSNQENSIVFFNDDSIFTIKEGVVKALYSLKEISLTQNELSRIIIDSNQSLIVCTNSNGVYEIARNNIGEITKLHHLSGISVNSAFIDKEKNTWLMSRKDGVYLLNQEARSVITYFDNFKIKALYDHGDFVFASTQTGELFQFNDKSSKHIDIPPNAHGKTLIHNFLELNHREILINTNYGIMKMNFNSQNIFHIEILNLLKDYKIVDMMADEKKNLFVCSVYDPFIVPADKYRSGVLPDHVHEELKNMRTFAIYPKNNAETYVSNINGLNLIRNNQLIKLWQNDPNLSARIVDITGINDSTQLLSTDGYGLILISNNKVFKKLNMESGLASPFCKKAVRIKNKIYICTNNGLSIYKIKGNTLIYDRSLTSDNGISSNDINDVVLKDDKLYIATEKGISIISNNATVEQFRETAPDIYFNSVLNNQKAIDFSNKFFIPNDQRNLVVNFTAITFDHPEKIVYQYKFNSESKNWTTSSLNEINFSQLEPGNYELSIRGRKHNSDWSRTISLNFVVEKPFYLETWFLILGSIVILGSVSVVIIYLNRRSQRNKIFELEKASLLNAERARISADMHDDLGSDLSKIGLLSYVIKTKYSLDQDIDDSLDKIYDSVNSTRKKADEIIWALNPQLDTSGDLLAFLTDYCLNFFEGSNIAITINKVGIKTEIPIRSRIRRDVFLITKEICNNVLKHSKAGNFNIVMKIDSGKLILEFKDDGIGFSIDEGSKNGNGLINIRKRVKEVNAIFEVVSSKGNGVTYILIIPIV